MIARLRGRVAHQNGEQIVLDVQGVGYLIHASTAAFGRLPADPAEDIELLIHTSVSENDISLFGFGSELERQAFLLLKRVKGIGSRLALAIVSAIGGEQLLGLIASGDVSALKQVPGIGKKTAERVIVELREQVGKLVEPEMSLAGQIEQLHAGRAAEPAAAGPAADALLALQKLGFPAERAKEAVDQAMQEDGGAGSDAGRLLQRALTYVAG